MIKNSEPVNEIATMIAEEALKKSVQICMHPTEDYWLESNLEQRQRSSDALWNCPKCNFYHRYGPKRPIPLHECPQCGLKLKYPWE